MTADCQSCEARRRRQRRRRLCVAAMVALISTAYATGVPVYVRPRTDPFEKQTR